MVGVRVAGIQEGWNPSSWRYANTEDNPADDLSRGITVEELCSGRWINGPSFLSKPKTEWPNERATKSEVEREDPERRAKKFLGISNETPTIVEFKTFLELGEANKSNHLLSTFC